MSHSPGRTDLTSLRITTALSVAQSTLRMMGFWVAIVLPLVYVPLTYFNHHWIVDFPNFLTVITVHVIAILGGMNHETFGEHL